jgi:hypothetical protein
VTLSDRANNQIPDHLPPVVLVLGAMALRVGEKPCGLPPITNPMMEILPEVMKTSGGRYQRGGCRLQASLHGRPQHFAAEAPLPLDFVPHSLSSPPPPTVPVKLLFFEHYRSQYPIGVTVDTAADLLMDFATCADSCGSLCNCLEIGACQRVSIGYLAVGYNLFPPFLKKKGSSKVCQQHTFLMAIKIKRIFVRHAHKTCIDPRPTAQSLVGKNLTSKSLLLIVRVVDSLFVESYW